MEDDESLCQTNPFDEDFLRDILQQPQVFTPDLNTFIGSSMSGHTRASTSAQHNKLISSPTTYILSFDKSTALLPTHLPHSNYDTNPSPSPTWVIDNANQGTNKTRRSASESLDHIMSERNRRQELTRKFIALASTIPGLKKMEKGHVLREAMNYVKELEERVEELEEEKKGTVEAGISIRRCHLRSEEWECDEALPEVEVRVLGKEVLIKIHCTKLKGVLRKIMSRLESLHLFISTTNVLPFGNTLDITIIAQMDEKYKLVVKDVVKGLRQVAMMKSCDLQP